MNSELIESLNILEKEKDISKEVIFEAIENSLIMAYKNNYGKADNVTVSVNRETGDFSIVADKTVVENPEDPATEISLEKAKELDIKYELGDVVKVDVKSRIRTYFHPDSKKHHPSENQGRRTKSSV